MTNDPTVLHHYRRLALQYAEEARVLRAEIGTLDSERLANEILTNELERANTEIQRLLGVIRDLQGLPSLPTEN